MFSQNDNRASGRAASARDVGRFEMLDDRSAHGIELAVTPLVFGALGWAIDRLAGTSPVFTIALAAFGVIGIVLKMWFTYDADMAAQEAKASWRRGAGTVTTADRPDDLWSAIGRSDDADRATGVREQ